MVCSLLAAGQPPDVRREVLVWDVNTPKPDDLQAALANHPDVQIAEAKLRVAQAELAKVKLTVAQQVTAAKAKVAAARADAEAAERELKRLQNRRRDKVVSDAETEQAARRSEQAKAILAVAEADLRAFVGVSAVGQTVTVFDTSFQSTGPLQVFGGTVAFNHIATAPPAQAGSVADKLRTALTKPLALKDGLSKVRPEEALDMLKQAGGFDLVVKWGPGGDGVVTLPAGERTLSAWLDLLSDDYDRENKVRWRVSPFVREYGLLLAAADTQPAGAVSLDQFAKQKPKAEPAATVPPELRDKLKAVMGKVVKWPDAPDAPVSLGIFLNRVLADAGSDMTVQGAMFTNEPVFVPGGEKMVAAWLQQIQDRINGGLAPTRSKHEFFVRDYGLLFCATNEAPPGAVPLSQVK